MHDLLDIYIKLLIAIITLLVPILIFYINHVSEAKKIKDNAYNQKIKDLQNNAQLDNSDSQTFTKQVTDLHSEIAKLELQRNKDAQLLNPLRQFKRIYTSLLSSFILIIIDVAVRNDVMNTYNHYLSIGLILASILLFSITVVIILNVVVVAIKSKEDIEKSA